MNKRICENDYQILFFEIENQILIKELAKSTGKNELDLAALVGNYAIDAINCCSTDINQKKVDKLKKLFAQKVLPEFNHE